MPKKQQRISATPTRTLRILIGGLLCTLTIASGAMVFILKTKEFVFESVFIEHIAKEVTPPQQVISFPIGVNPTREAIEENPTVDSYFEMHISAHSKRPTKTTWLGHTIAKLAQLDWYQNLASPLSRILVVQSGERKEEVISNFGSILRWDKDEKEKFEELVTSSIPEISEGKFFPGRYVVDSDASPEEIATLLLNEFEQEVASRYSEEIAAVVPLQDALTIASLLEREAYDFDDMRYISGIIWNRLFIDMNLQLDASLQYVKGSSPSEPWWPQVHPRDKYLNSPFNTYQNEGLPPAPIANPSPEAILAALNPRNTECLFYFHDKDGGFHCTATYDEHVSLLKQYYGRGK